MPTDRFLLELQRDHPEIPFASLERKVSRYETKQGVFFDDPTDEHLAEVSEHIKELKARPARSTQRTTTSSPPPKPVASPVNSRSAFDESPPAPSRRVSASVGKKTMADLSPPPQRVSIYKDGATPTPTVNNNRRATNSAFDSPPPPTNRTAVPAVKSSRARNSAFDSPPAPAPVSRAPVSGKDSYDAPVRRRSDARQQRSASNAAASLMMAVKSSTATTTPPTTTASTSVLTEEQRQAAFKDWVHHMKTSVDEGDYGANLVALLGKKGVFCLKETGVGQYFDLMAMKSYQKKGDQFLYNGKPVATVEESPSPLRVVEQPFHRPITVYTMK